MTSGRRKQDLNIYTDKLTATHADLLTVSGDVVYKNYCNYQTECKKINHKKPDKIDSCLLRYYIRDHNLIIGNLDKDYYNATHIALQCILHGWSVASLKHLDIVYVFICVSYVFHIPSYCIIFCHMCFICASYVFIYVLYAFINTSVDTLYVLIYAVNRHMKD